jgi:hypothetical protein
MKIVNSRDNDERQSIFLVLLALLSMAILATLGESLVKVLWSGFGILFLAIFIWSLANGRHSKN